LVYYQNVNLVNRIINRKPFFPITGKILKKNNMKLSPFARSFIMTFILVITVSISVQAQATSFNYQGRLTDASMPATSGTYDFEFALYDANGTLVAPNSTATTGITVTNGSFAIKLDFGSSAFNGADRYLEIRVKKPTDSNYTQLSPRQQINSAPYAIRSISAGTADTATNATNANTLDNIDSSSFVQTNSNQFIRNQTTLELSANFNVGGTGRASIFDAATQYNILGNRVLSVAGTNNLFAGVNTGGANVYGSGNSFVGTEAGQNTTGGSNNSFFGYSAGKGNTLGIKNSFVGYFAGYSNLTGNSNSFVGSKAGLVNSEGSSNSFFGDSAGSSNTTGEYNSFVGAGTGFHNMTGISNSFVGASAGRENTNGNRNSFFGNTAGYNNTTGSNNTIMGYSANVGDGNLSFAAALGSNALVSASDTIVLGKVAGTYNGTARPADTVQIPGNLTVAGTLSANINGSSITNLNASNITTGTLDSARLGVIPIVKGGTGSATQNFVDLTTNQTIAGDKTFSNTLSGNAVNSATQYNIAGNRVLSVFGISDLFIGIGAGASVSTNAGSTFVGTLAGNSNTTGAQNAFFGNQAGRANTTGGANAFFGSRAGVSNSTGNYNSFFGYDTGFSNTTGEVNSFFGHAAGFNNTSGFRNSFFGVQAGTSNTIGNYNSFFGGWAGYSNSGEHNSFMGDNAGRNNTSGSRNSFFGKDAGLGNTDGSSNTLMGSKANVSAGNLVYATAVGAEALVSTSNTVVLGRTADTVVAPNLLQVGALGAAGSTALCRNNLNQISTCAAANLNENSPVEQNTTTANALLEQKAQINAQQAQIELQQKEINELKAIVCSIKSDATVCKGTKK
jgi:hypothetical protein